MCPLDGMIYSLIMPTMHTQCLQIFSNCISTQHLNELVVLVADGALTDALLDLDEDPITLQMLTGHPWVYLGS